MDYDPGDEARLWPRLTAAFSTYSMTASALADKHKAHVKLLLVSAALGALLRSSMPLADSAVLVMVMLLAGELIGAPTGVLGDSTVLSNCKDVSPCSSLDHVMLGMCVTCMPYM